MPQKSSTKRTGTQTKKKNALTEAKRIQHNRAWSTVIFIIGVFLIFLTWLKGEALWSGMQDILWGLFGVSAILLAPVVIYVAVMLAMDKSKSAVVVKVIQGAALILLVSPLFEIIHGFSTGTEAFAGEGFGSAITTLYKNGAELRQGGGALSIFLGGALSALLGDVGALIVIILLIVLFVMLLTNITFVDLWKGIARLAGKIKESVESNDEEKAARQIEKEEEAKKAAAIAAKEEAKPKKWVDVAKYITDQPSMPEHPADNAASEGLGKPEKKKRKGRMTPADFIADEQSSEQGLSYETQADKGAEEAAKAAEDKPDGAAEPYFAPVSSDDVSADDNLISGSETVNPIYVGKDGQTTLIEMDEASPSDFVPPPIELLNPPQQMVSDDDTRNETDRNSETLVETLRSFGVATRIVGIHRGPSVTRYELQPAAGVKVSKITSLVDDIALNLAANGVRIEAPIPGKAAVGIELANKLRETVCIREVIDSNEFRSAGGKLCFPVGKDVEGKIIIGDISKMPHILIAGTTGSGKSVFTNSIIMSVLYNASPDEVKLILIDPKQVEFPVYNGIPHLLIPVVTEAKKAAGALGWAVTEMLKRYKLFADNGVRDLKDYNKAAAKSDVLTPLPQILIIVDELADLMMAAPKEVEDSICRLAQLARAAGMHLVIATQSPRVDIVTGLIKANIPSRVALKVSNQVDSRVILDEGGAEKLLGNGDLLYKPVGLGKPVRVQGSFVATEEIKRVVDYLKAQTSSQYDEEVATEIEKHIPVPKGEKQAEQSQESSSDNMTERAIEAVVEAGQASTSYLQRRLKLGYARAARIMDELEEMGIVGPADGAKPREVRMTKAQLLERRAYMGSSGKDGLEE